ncbi:hypothetical protein ABPG77_001696 [Micractinium sp. CCAP 211/92]
MRSWNEAFTLLEFALRDRSLLDGQLIDGIIAPLDALAAYCQHPLQGSCSEQRLARALETAGEQLNELTATVSGTLARGGRGLALAVDRLIQASILSAACFQLVMQAWTTPAAAPGAMPQPRRSANSTRRRAVLALVSGAHGLLQGLAQAMQPRSARLDAAAQHQLLTGQLRTAQNVLDVLEDPCWQSDVVTAIARAAKEDAIELLVFSALALRELDRRLRDTSHSCPIAYVALAQIALGCANPLTPTAPTAPSPSLQLRAIFSTACCFPWTGCWRALRRSRQQRATQQAQQEAPKAARSTARCRRSTICGLRSITGSYAWPHLG